MKTSRVKLLLLAALACIGALGADQFVIGPLIETWKARSTRIQQVREDLERGSQLVELRDRYAANWHDMQDASLISDPAGAEKILLSSVDAWARASGLNVSNYKPNWMASDDEIAQGARKLEIQLSGSGNLQTIARFLYELERNELAVKLEDFGISARDDKGRELSLDARFTGLLLSREDQS